MTSLTKGRQEDACIGKEDRLRGIKERAMIEGELLHDWREGVRLKSRGWGVKSREKLIEHELWRAMRP